MAKSSRGWYMLVFLRVRVRVMACKHKHIYKMLKPEKSVAAVAIITNG